VAIATALKSKDCGLLAMIGKHWKDGWLRTPTPGAACYELYRIGKSPGAVHAYPLASKIGKLGEVARHPPCLVQRQHPPRC
jgi:hypothetical protein